MSRLSLLKNVGPGIVLAATGLGAGDLVAAIIAGKLLGVGILWAVLIGAGLKFTLNEALARWQLHTGETLLEAWCRRLPRWLNWLFFAYLLLWATLVGAALMAACGLAAHALMPQLSVNAWALLHSGAAMVLVLAGRYQMLERAMKLLIGLMFVTVLGSLILREHAFTLLLEGLLQPRLPEGSTPLVLGLLGGVGGSVTLLCYSYWMQEKAWRGESWVAQVRLDLATGYALTALFGIAVLVLAAEVQPDLTQGTRVILDLADALGRDLGPVPRLLFLLGFWGAVASSMLGVWQGVPYLMRDFVTTEPSLRSRTLSWSPQHIYRGFLLYLGTVPLALLWFGKPLWLVLIYSVAGAFFMPLLALALWHLQRRYLTRPGRPLWLSQAGLLLTLAVFAALGLSGLWAR